MIPTIRDVAERAGVAPITVSRVINNSGYVSPDTRARVEAAIAELQYLPNTLASSFRWRRTRVLALILTDITNPFWTTVARGVEDVANQHAFNVILCNTDEDEHKQMAYVRVLLQKRVDGFLLVPTQGAPEAAQLIQRRNVPLVVLDRLIAGVQVDVVRGDSEGGAYVLTQRLIAQGHRRIAMLSGPRHISTATQRVEGYQRAMNEAGLAVGDELVHYGDYSQTGGYWTAKKVLALVPRPTALFAANNFIALGALRAVREAGLRVPEDVSLVCFDDTPIWADPDPFLTVAAQPAYLMGQRATELLLARLSGQVPPEPREVILPVEIVVRRSCASVQQEV